MPTIQNILFPVDFSERCLAAAPFVKDYAQTFDAKVTLISALAPIWQFGVAEAGAALNIDMEELRKDLEVRLNGAFVEELSGIPVSRVTKIGEPGEVITEYAHAEGVDLIMMPTHGYGPFRALLLGSVTSKVLHDAECPVWTAAHVEKTEVGAHRPIRKIVCAFEGTEKSVAVVRWANEFAQKVGASMRIVHAVTGVEAWPEAVLNRNLEDELASDARNKIESALPPEIDAPLCIEAGDPAIVLQHEIEKHGSDLVVIGRGISQESLGRLRTQSYGIIRHSPCPVISV